MFPLGLASMGVCLAFTIACEHIREAPAMTYVTIAVTAAVIIYLFAALVRPEWF